MTDPEATFSACFGAAFLVWHPARYAELLAEKMRKHGSNAWLVSTGWSGGGFGVGQRMKLTYTRAIIDAIHDGALDQATTTTDPVFGLNVVTECPHVPGEILTPRDTWQDKRAYDAAAIKLAKLFQHNFKTYEDVASKAILDVGPRVG